MLVIRATAVLVGGRSGWTGRRFRKYMFSEVYLFIYFLMGSQLCCLADLGFQISLMQPHQ
jgi:hypothetical protein